MQMYSKIINKETKEVEQCNTSGRWYIAGKMPADEKATDLRAQRDDLLSSLDWIIARYNEQKTLGVETTDSEQDFIDLLQYKQYLRDITKDPTFPDIQIKTFEEFKTNKG